MESDPEASAHETSHVSLYCRVQACGGLVMIVKEPFAEARAVQGLHEDAE